ncbi:hypothetical protein [Limimaricola litoreus]|uniref:Sodium/calcium exchanger membrane region domain-containing protein n=1 Tax=Limimaricola litoreus TaxID=2955316 RepID=A0A9X2FRH8_9RHOB|nr:hypothetical protein [Limimaricola litoreus]
MGFDTSTPELVTSVKGAPGIAYGNAIGSNIYDILGIAGVTAMVSPGPVATEILGFDNLVMTAASLVVVVVVVVLVWTGPRSRGARGRCCWRATCSISGRSGPEAQRSA